MLKRLAPAAIVTAAILSPLLARSARAEEAAATMPSKVSKSGIPYLTDEQVGPPDLVQAIRSRRTGGKLLNLDRILLHSPNFTKGWNAQFAAIRNQLSLPGNLREIAIMAIGALNHADYEWIQHEPEFLKAGGTKAQLAAIKKDAAGAAKDAKLFDEKERAALQLTAEMTRKVAASPATMKRVRSLLPDGQVVELVGTIAGYNMVSRFVSTLGIEAEDSAPVKAAAK
jgi:alkylhydroperoxidase family enzyme